MKVRTHAYRVIVAALLILASVRPSIEECAGPCSMSDLGVALVKHFEGYELTCYRDPAGYWTVGYGHLVRSHEYDRLCSTPLLPREADSLLRLDLAREVGHVHAHVDVELQQRQLDAVGSWTYNLGAGNLRSSTMLRRINRRRHCAVPDEIRKWNRAGGRVLLGLQLRREAEAWMYRSGTRKPCN